MKTRNNMAVFILTSVICLLPVIFALAIYNDLPEQIAVHWDTMGNPDGFAHKAAAAFGLPALFVVINLVSKLALYTDPKRANTSEPMRIIAEWIPPVLALFTVPVTLLIAMGVNISISFAVPVLVGFLLIICGNYLPKSRQNYTVGIKLPWTLHNADNWNKTHRMAGYLYVFCGIAIIVGAFMSGTFSKVNGIILIIPVVAVLVIVPVIYSFLLYRKSASEIDGAEG